MPEFDPRTGETLPPQSDVITALDRPGATFTDNGTPKTIITKDGKLVAVATSSVPPPVVPVQEVDRSAANAPAVTELQEKHAKLESVVDELKTTVEDGFGKLLAAIEGNKAEANTRVSVTSTRLPGNMTPVPPKTVNPTPQQ